LTPRGALYRLRVGTWRIIYELSRGFIDVLGIVSRAELERFLKGL
jgi:mRNA-degrading endonuclease RelE of RelBE toxin-antitoxin system